MTWPVQLSVGDNSSMRLLAARFFESAAVLRNLPLSRRFSLLLLLLQDQSTRPKRTRVEQQRRRWLTHAVGQSQAGEHQRGRSLVGATGDRELAGAVAVAALMVVAG